MSISNASYKAKIAELTQSTEAQPNPDPQGSLTVDISRIDKYAPKELIGREEEMSLLEKTWSDAENLALAIEQMPESQLWEHFVDEEYGNYYRCLHGPIEHCHYHVGQIAMLKTLLSSHSLEGDRTEQ